MVSELVIRMIFFIRHQAGLMCLTSINSIVKEVSESSEHVIIHFWLFLLFINFNINFNFNNNLWLDVALLELS
jgi:hypothetical protein